MTRARRACRPKATRDPRAGASTPRLQSAPFTGSVSALGRGGLSAALGLGAGLGLAACSEGADLVSLVGDVAVTPDALDFGPVPAGAVRRLTVQVENRGTGPLVLADLMTAEPFFAELTPSAPLPVRVPPGGRLILDVGFAPREGAEPASGSLRVLTDDPDEAETDVLLQGVRVEGVLTVSPPVLDFRGTPVGAAVGGEVLAENLGLAPIQGRLVADGFRNPGYFRSRDAPIEGELTVPARGAVPFDIEYRPLEPGDDRGVVRFEICDGRCGVEVRIDATAVAPAVRVEPPLVDLGRVDLGAERVARLEIINSGTENAVIVGVSARNGAGLDVVPERSLPTTVGAGGRLGLELRYAPEEAVDLDAVVEVDLEDPRLPQLEAIVVGSGVGPRFLVQPERLSFGAVTERRPTRRTVLAVNVGSSVVQVESVAIAGDPSLRLDALPGLPLSLGAGETLPVGVLFEPSALGSATATLAFSTSDPGSPEVRVPVLAGLAERVCELDIWPETVNFGALVPTFERERIVRVLNDGTEACTLVEGAFRAPSDPALTRVDGARFPITLSPTTYVDLRFRYAPEEERETKGVFTIQTDEPLFPLRNLTFLGTGAPYDDVFTQPRVVDFGQVRPSCPSAEATVEILNAGTGAVQVSALSLEEATPDLALDGPAPPFLIPVGGSASFRVRYDPVAEGVAAGVAVVDVEELPYPLVVPVRGQGSDAPTQVDAYVQNLRAAVDVLFVIDDSGSMIDEQEAIARNFQSFIRRADTRNVDFRIGVTTTTVRGGAGRLVGPPLDRQTPDLENAFRRQTNVGTTGSGIELGLEALRGAYRRAESGFAPNVDLFRSEAEKVFVVISDEDDQSPAPPRTYAAEILQRFNRPTMAVVTGGRDGCTSDSGFAFPAPRYAEFVGDLEGISASICADWSQTLSLVGEAAFGLRRRFPLTRTPDESQPIEVRLDGRRLTPSEYALEALPDPAVLLDPPPIEGAVIEIRYVPACSS